MGPFTAIALAAVLTRGPGLDFSCDGLSPERRSADASADARGAADPYVDALARFLLPERTPLVQLIFVPSFTREEAVYVERGADGSFRAVYAAISDGSVWVRLEDALEVDASSHGSYPATGPATAGEVLARMSPQVERVAAPISRDTAERLANAWRAALARFCEQERFGADGETYHFGASEPSGNTRLGSVWSPQDGSRMSALVALGRGLVSLAAAAPAERAGIERALAREADAFVARMRGGTR